MTPGAGGPCASISHIVKMHYFLKNLSSLFPVRDHTNYLYSIYDQGKAYQIVNFMTPGAGVLMLGRGHMSL